MGEQLNIAVFGVSLRSSYRNPLIHYFRNLLDALSRRQCRITFYESDALDRPLRCDCPPLPQVRSVVYPAKLSDLKACLREALENDVIVKIGPTGVFDEVIEQSVLEARRDGQAVCYWDTRGPALPEALREHPDSPLHRTLRESDLLLTCGGGQRFVRACLRLGAPRCLPVFPALNPRTHFPNRSREGGLADFSFIIDHLPSLEEKIEEFFLEPARQLPGRRFLLAGQGWAYCRELPANVRRLGPLSHDRQNILNSSSMAVLNILDQGVNGYGPFVPPRLCEAAGAGACILTEDFEGLESFLMPQSECIPVQDARQVVEVLDSMTVQTARSVGANARRRMRAQHTCDHRAKEIRKAISEMLLNPRKDRLRQTMAAG